VISNNSFSKLHIAVDDVSAGYNNLPTDREYVTCAWDDEVKAARFYTSSLMMFGSTASVNHSCRLPSLIERLGARLFGTLARAYVDDRVITDFVAAGDSAQQALAAIHPNMRAVANANATRGLTRPPVCQSVRADAPAKFRSFWGLYVTSLKRTLDPCVTLPDQRVVPRCSGN